MPDPMRLISEIAQVGHLNPAPPDLGKVEPFAPFLLPNGSLDSVNLDRRDGACTRREVLLRYLVLSAVLDQGPDIVGIRQMLLSVTNALYRREIRFLHSPLSFFREIGVAIDRILETHDSIKDARSAIWAAENQSRASKYNLFMDNSHQALNYAVFRWGVPLALPLLLEKDSVEENREDVLTRYLKKWKSAEEMSSMLKDSPRYGLGKAVGDKACHLFAKWAISSFGLLRDTHPSWGDMSYEIPFDSNAGRVLWRTGFFLAYANEEEYAKRLVIQRRAGKGGLHYIRVTNIRGMKATRGDTASVWPDYVLLCREHLRSHSREPRSIEIQRLPQAMLLSTGSPYGVAEIDDGLIYIGTKVCFNHDTPKCQECPMKNACKGFQTDRHLISDYRT